MIRDTKELTMAEKAVYTKIESELKVVFDVGAANSFLNKLDCEVHFFEPMENRFTELVNMTPPNDKYTYNMSGCGSKNTTMDLYGAIGSTEWRELPPRFGVKEDSPVERIKIVRLDDYITEKGIEEISLLKLDIEGAEYEALLGMGDHLTKCKYITFEYGWDMSESFGFKLRDILDLLTDFDVFQMNDPQPINNNMIKAMEAKVVPNLNYLIAIRK